MLHAIPLTVVPLIFYNIVAFAFGSADAVRPPVDTILLGFNLVSGGRLELSWGDVIILVALVCLFVEIVKSTRSATSSVTDNLLSMLIFVIYLVEFLLVAKSATSTFFILLAIAFLDIVTGFAVSVRTARRDIALERPDTF